MKALVVDDSRAIRTILSRTLEDLGFEVGQACDGVQAAGYLDRQRESTDLILVDWNMPEMNGLEFVRHLRRDGRFAATKVMMVTTETQAEEMAAALEAGANEYVMKPFTQEVIVDKLRILGLV